LLKHVYGMYYFNRKQLTQCITTLESIDLGQYHNEEYFYHLALAHHFLLSNTKAYYFASKALDFFHRTYNVSRVIDTEMFMLIQLNVSIPHNFDYTKNKYMELIDMCDTCHDLKRKSKLLHNLAFEYKRRGYFQEAYHHYQEAFKYIDEGDPLYISILDGYIDVCWKGNMLTSEKLLDLCQQGMDLVKNERHNMYFYFKLHSFTIQKKEDQYFQYVEQKMIPHFRKTGYTMEV